MKRFLLVAVCLLTCTLGLKAATLTVTKTPDTNDNVCDADCSLREAIFAAGAGDTINFSPLFNNAQLITLTGTELFIDKSLTINGTGADKLTIDGNFQSRVFHINGAGIIVNLNGLKIIQGRSMTNGGGVAIVTASVNMNRIWIDGNTVDSVSAPAIFGAGIDNLGDLTISESTISNNSILSNNVGRGAGIMNGRLLTPAGLTVENSTISGNILNAVGGGGGGVHSESTLIVRGSTINNNFALQGSGTNNGFLANSTLSSTIIAGNTGSPDAFGNYTSGGFNLIGDGTGATSITQPTDQLGTTAAPLDPLLGALVNNGGTTPTHALLAGSPAIDKGNAFGLLNDQRGLARTVDNTTITNAAGGDGTDIGAFEILAPTAAGAAIRGRVSLSNGRAVARAVITLTNMEGITRSTRSNQFGYFNFEEVEVGQIYIISAQAKGLTFSPQILAVKDSVGNLIITANFDFGF